MENSKIKKIVNTTAVIIAKCGDRALIAAQDMMRAEIQRAMPEIVAVIEKEEMEKAAQEAKQEESQG